MHTALAVVLGLVLTAAVAWSAQDVATRPNIIVIYTDDQGFGDASCLNPEAKCQTPTARTRSVRRHGTGC